MPKYRIFYAGRSPTVPGIVDEWRPQHPLFAINRGQRFTETEYEEVIEAPTASAALEAFFPNHVESRNDVMRLGADGRAERIRSVGDYDPEETYLWIEGDSMMEYQGVDEMTAGLVTCPLCSGTGEIDAGLAEYYEEAAAKQREQPRPFAADIQG